MNFIDSHFHSLCLVQRMVSLDELFTSLYDKGFCGGLDIGLGCDDLKVRMDLLKPYRDIRFALGSGPWELDERDSIDSIMEIIKENLKLKPSAIGEIGLDYYWSYSTHERQKELFVRQLDLAYENRLPVVIHSRDSMDDTLKILESHKARGIFHCFSGTREQALELQDQGWLISFAGNLTYNKNTAIQESLRAIRPSSIMLETDSPYLSPVPYRGKTNTPLLILETYKKASLIRGISEVEMGQTVTDNFMALFNKQLS